jgi:hypothetical protein
MAKQKYTTDPKEVYALELEKLQRCFSEVQRVGEEASELQTIGWRQVDCLRHVNFILMEAVQTGDMLISGLTKFS